MRSADALTVGDAAEALGVKAWQVRRLYERGILPEPARAGMYRLIRRGDLPLLRKALRDAGYLSGEAAGV